MLVKIHGETQKEKLFAEIKFVESKIMNLFNTMNNIETTNYHVVTNQLSKESTEKSESNSSSGESSGDNSGGESFNQTQGDNSEDKKQDNKKFELKSNGTLTYTEQINWDSVKDEVEKLYTTIPSLTMDLYQMNVKQEDVLAFNNQYDNLTTAVKDEKKEETLAELTKVYEFLPKFLKDSGQDEIYTVIVETKNNVLKGYSKLDNENWEEIANDIKNSIDIYSKLLSNTNIDTSKQYNISKSYVMLNELQNAVNLKDSSVFLIKYRNLIEELNQI